MANGVRIFGLSKSYGNVCALDKITLDIPRGVFGLLGPNGAGKSTLMRTIATLQEPDSGSILLDDIDVLGQKQLARQNLGFLPQEFGVYPKSTPLQLLDYFAKLKGFREGKTRKEMICHLLRVTNLWSVRNRLLGAFSGGMRQRFGIAQALIGNPKLVIVDEPTAGLDPVERARLLDLLCELSDRATILLSTHIVDDVEAICPHMAIISAGKIIARGKTSDAIDALSETVWQTQAPHAEVLATVGARAILCRRLSGGKATHFVHAGLRPGHAFVSARPTLEHVYFYLLQMHSGDSVHDISV